MSFSSENVIFDVRRISKLPILCKLAFYITAEIEGKSVYRPNHRITDKNLDIGKLWGCILSPIEYHTSLYICVERDVEIFV